MYAAFFLLLLLIATRATSENQKVVERFNEHAIVPSVISTPPPACLIVKYLAGNFTVKLGNELKPDSTKEAPCNVTWPAEASSLYTLVMVDPDAPSRKMPLVGEVLHWLVINIQDPSKISDGKEIVPYLGNSIKMCD